MKREKGSERRRLGEYRFWREAVPEHWNRDRTRVALEFPAKDIADLGDEGGVVKCN